MGFQSSRNVPEKLSNLITQSGSTILWAPYGRVISQFLEVVPKMAAGRKAGEVWAPKVKRFYVFWGNNLQSAHAAASATIDSAAGLVICDVNQPLREALLDSTIYTGLEVNLPWELGKTSQLLVLKMPVRGWILFGRITKEPADV